MVPKALDIIFGHKQILDNGDILDIKIERIERTKDYPEGIRHSLVYVRDNINLVRFDNHHGQKSHKHIKGKKLPYEFIDEWKLVGDFLEDLNKLGIDLDHHGKN